MIDHALVVFLVSFLAAVPFALVAGQRPILLALFCMKPKPRYAFAVNTKPGFTTLVDSPVYNILVPPFRIENVFTHLIAALAALQYPTAKLDVILIL